MKIRQVALLVIAGCLVLGPCLQAAAIENEIEISGLLVNRTTTRAGRSFYRFFSSLWIPPEKTGGYNIIISEKATPQAGSWIWVRVNDIVVTRNIVGRRNADIQKMAEQAVRRVTTYVKQTHNTAHAPLEGEDLLGDGL